MYNFDKDNTFIFLDLDNVLYDYVCTHGTVQYSVVEEMYKWLVNFCYTYDPKLVNISSTLNVKDRLIDDLPNLLPFYACIDDELLMLPHKLLAGHYRSDAIVYFYQHYLDTNILSDYPQYKFLVVDDSYCEYQGCTWMYHALIPVVSSRLTSKDMIHIEYILKHDIDISLHHPAFIIDLAGW